MRIEIAVTILPDDILPQVTSREKHQTLLDVASKCKQNRKSKWSTPKHVYLHVDEVEGRGFKVQTEQKIQMVDTKGCLPSC